MHELIQNGMLSSECFATAIHAYACTKTLYDKDK